MHQEMYATSDYGIPIKNSKYRSARYLVFSHVHLLYTSYFQLLGRHGSVSLCRDERENKMAATYNVLAFKR